MSDGMPKDAQGVDMMALARDRMFDALEAEWMRRLDPPPEDLSELFGLAEYMVRRQFAEQAALLLWSLVTAVAQKSPPARALESALRAATIVPAAATLREEALTLYRRAHPDVPELPAILEAADLRRTKDIPAAVRMIDSCLRMRPGTYVIHIRSRRVGKVERFQDGRFDIASEGTRQSLAPAEVLGWWEPLDGEDFRALAAFEPERLRALAQSDPARLVEMALRVYSGRMDFKQLKFMLIPAVIPQARWSAWWNSVKVPLRRAPRIEIGPGTQPAVSIRQGAASYADTIRVAFRDAPNAFERARQVIAWLAEIAAGHGGDATLAADLAAGCMETAKAAPDAASRLALLSAASVLHEHFAETPDPAAQFRETLAALTDVAPAVKAIEGEDLTRLALDCARKAAPERGAELLAQAFPGGSLRLCEWIAKELNGIGRTDLLRAAAERTLAAPDLFPEAYGWVWRWALGGEPAAQGLDGDAITVTLLALMGRLARVPKHVERQTELRQALGKLRNMVSSGDYRLTREVIARSNLELARRFHEAIRNNDGITDDSRHELLAALHERHPEEFLEKKPLWDDGMIHTSEEGLAKRHAEMEKIVNEEMPRNAQAIGKAASLGDLRENWEYKAALEERDRLVERAGRVRQDLNLARVLDTDLITGDEVNIATAVTLREVNGGAMRRVSFVGPWDADIAQGIYSYQAPLSQRFMGHKVGDRVSATLGDHEAEYEIVKIEKL